MNVKEYSYSFFKNTSLKGILLKCIFAVVLFLGSWKVYQAGIGLPFNKKIFLVVSLVLVLAIVLASCLKQLHHAVFVIIVLVGGVFACTSPTVDVPDEFAHTSRAIFISEGNVNLGNKDFEVRMSENWRDLLPKKKTYLTESGLDKKEILNKKSVNRYLKITNAYAFISYLPSVVGILIAKVLGLSFFWLIVLGRLTNLLFYAFVSAFAVKKVKQFKIPLTMMALLPMNIYFAASFNQDTFSFAILLLAFSILTNILFAKEKIDYKLVLLYTFLCSILVFTKLPYVLLVGALVFIPIKKYASRLQYFGTYGLSLFVAVLSLVWFKLYSQINTSNVDVNMPPAGVDVAGQLEFMLQHKILGIKVLLKGLFGLNSEQLFKFGPLSYFSSQANILFIMMFAVIFFFAPVKKGASTVTRIGLALISLGIALAIQLSMYLSWTPVGWDHIQGVQSRYYIGVLVFLPLVTNIFRNTLNAIGLNDSIEKVNYNSEKVSDVVLYASMLLLILMTAISLANN